jgi:DNA-binding XRE family transcriptional regulator
VVLRPVSLDINLLRYAHMDNKEDKVVRAKLSVLLKEARESAGLTQAEVAKQAGVNANYYSVVERGEGNLSYVKLRRILKVLKIKSLDIL